MTPALAPSHLRAADVLGVGLVGLRSRRLRALLTAAGIAIGIAAMVAVIGISTSSRAELLATLDRLGTNLLRVSPGQTRLGESATLPKEAPAMIRRIAPVRQAAAVGTVDATVRRTDRIPEAETGGIRVVAAEPELLDAVGGTLADGAFINDATARYPAAVLGAAAAERLGIREVGDQPLVWIAGRWFAAVGILDPLPLAAELDDAVLIGWNVAEEALGFDGAPNGVYVRAEPDDLDAVRGVLQPTANPEAPDEVEVARPSDALAARAAASSAFTALLLGLGGVALLVGGIGIANVMVIAVLERRAEIGVRRALGATRRHVRIQFLTEAALLAGLGGLAGVGLGAAVTAAYARARGWAVVVPALGLLGGLVLAVTIGALAGLYPASRAARLPPAEAVRT